MVKVKKRPLEIKHKVKVIVASLKMALYSFISKAVFTVCN
jgi:hypothetical protein